MPSIPQTEALKVRAMLARAMPNWDIDLIRDFEFLSGGYGNRNYRFTYKGDSYVVRLPGVEHPLTSQQRRNESSFYDHPSSLSRPEILYSDPVSGLMISRWLPGKLLVDRPVEPAHLIAYLRTVHEQIPEAQSTYDPIAIAKRYLLEGDVPDPVKRLAATTIWRPAQLASCHNDLNPWNVIVSDPEPAAWATLDWETWGLNDPLFDLVTLFVGFNPQWHDELHDFAAGYLGYRPIDARLQSCVTAFWLREYAWAHGQWHRGNTRAEIGAQMASALQRLST